MALANGRRGEVALEVEGREYVLYFGNNEMCALEEELGRSINEIIDECNKDHFRASTFRRVLRAMLSRYQPELTLEQVGDLLDAGQDRILVALERAIARGQPDPKADPKAGDARPPKRGRTGGSTGTG